MGNEVGLQRMTYDETVAYLGQTQPVFAALITELTGWEDTDLLAWMQVRVLVNNIGATPADLTTMKGVSGEQVFLVDEGDPPEEWEGREEVEDGQEGRSTEQSPSAEEE